MSPKKSNQKGPEDKLASLIGLEFQDKATLHKALVHRSYLNENPNELESNERLEFLGDAVLEYIVSDFLYHKFVKQDEGHLTALRAKLVNTNALSLVAQRLNLGNLLYLSRGEEKMGGRTNKALLANTTEALIGAIYLDQGPDTTSSFIEDFVLDSLDEIVKHSLKDPKSMLQEYVQAQGLPAPVYKTTAEVGPDHQKQFTVQVIINKEPFAVGSGASKQIAAQDAAKSALDKWNQQK